jgi:hypothetical protein
MLGLLIVIIVSGFLLIFLIKVNNSASIRNPSKALTDNSISLSPAINVVITAARRVSLDVDLASNTECQGLDISVAVPANTTIVSLRDPQDRSECLAVGLMQGEDQFQLAVKEPKGICQDLTSAVAIGNLSNGKAVYRLADPNTDRIYTYHTEPYLSNPSPNCAGYTSFAELHRYGAITVTCSKDTTFCDTLAKSIVVNDEMY